MQPLLRERLAAIPWSNYETAYGNAANDHAFETAAGQITSRWGSIPDQLVALASTDQAQALEATHHLWCCLCHQHAYVSSAALPALPFLLEALDDAGEQLTIEILDILIGFALCSRIDDGASWIGQLRAKLVAERQRFETLAGHSNEEIAGYARGMLTELGG